MSWSSRKSEKIAYRQKYCRSSGLWQNYEKYENLIEAVCKERMSSSQMKLPLASFRLSPCILCERTLWKVGTRISIVLQQFSKQRKWSGESGRVPLRFMPSHVQCCCLQRNVIRKWCFLHVRLIATLDVSHRHTWNLWMTMKFKVTRIK